MEENNKAEDSPISHSYASDIGESSNDNKSSNTTGNKKTTRYQIISSKYVKKKKINHESCPVCDCRFDPKLHDHAKNRRVYVCGLCQKSFTMAKELKRHFNAHLYEYPFTCKVCNKGFQRSGSLNIHKKTVHGMGVRSSVTVRNYKCAHCPKTFITKSNLTSHQRVHSEKRPFHCSDCPRGFKTRFELKSHRLIHSNEKPYICPICHKGFRQSGNLNSHIRVHNEERPFVCQICGNSFRESSKLKRHHRLHTQEKPYSCSVCGRLFRDLSNMKKHHRTHFKNSDSLKIKETNVSEVLDEDAESQSDTIGENNTYICNICGEAFYEMTEAQEHVKCHKEEEEEETNDMIVYAVDDTNSSEI